MAPGDHTAMFGSSLPNFVCLKDTIPDSPYSETKPGHRKGSVMFYPPPSLKGPFMEDNVFHEVRRLSELQRIKCQRNILRQEAQLELRNDVEEDDIEEMSEVIEMRHKFYIIVPVVGYSSEDISIKAVGDTEIIIESKSHAVAAHEDQESLHMLFTLPAAIRLNAVKTAISSDQTLVITAPKIKRKL